MKKRMITLLFSLTAIALWAQPPGVRGRGAAQGPSIKGKITGTVIDSVAQAPVEFATLVLKSAADGKQVNGGITDDKGEFKLQDVPNGTYEIHLSFIGYTAKVVKGVVLTPEKPDRDVGVIYLQPDNITLSEVEVTSERALVENKIDKIVFNADQDLTTIGGDASDVLRKAPLLSVDIDGNVSLRGSQNVQILVNGRPSSLFAQNPGEALKSIPADQIKSVEVITTPSARYDGEGTAGIINIITKKKSVQGFTGSVFTSIGTRINRGSASLSVSSGRFGLNATASGWGSWPRDGYSEFLREDFSGDTVRTLVQNGDSESQTFGPRGSVGAFYDINAYNSLNTSLTFGGFGSINESVTNAAFTAPMAGIDQAYSRLNSGESLRASFDWNTDYRKTFKTEGQELIFAFQWSGAQGNQDNLVQQVGNNESLAVDERNANDSYNNEYTLQADYVHPFNDRVKMETGLKGVLRRIDSDSRYEVYNANDDAYLRDASRSNIFLYDQDVYAGYLSFNVKLGEKYGLVAGARYEYTDIRGDFEDEAADAFTNDYANILPSIILSRKLKNFSTVKASYARRIQRPSLFFVNPFVNLNDPFSVTTGNPLLSPELTDQYEVNYSTFVKGLSFNASVFYRKTADVIQQFQQEVDAEGVSRTTYLNVGENQSIGFNLFTSATIAKRLTLRGGVNVFTFDTESVINGQRLSNEAVLFNGNINGSFDFGKGYKMEAFGFYRAPRQTVQGKIASFSLFSMSFQKEFSKRFSLGINMTEPFIKFKEFPNEISGPDFYQRSTSAVLFRSFGLNINYRFGKLDFRQQRRGSKIRNDDLKDGGGAEF
ncbi:TonB-dependent receptor domain-containing protein [Phaeodactylibacter luteus]|uniref:TonB-dependent receptor n=1 Tax=Phaeodactylibacter luteus TaxID=1564516 RepID=A0A5C6RYT8_9BACT|nr:TonB-dependent receptor [Phaeodactylibacter luteus]TXB67558.1 TonB-dependent receptor [Phaeodactylibacter luteus]